MATLVSLAIGLAGGTLGGLVGLGGGFVMVPLMVYLLHMSQHDAQGTSLAILLPPVGLFAVVQYYRGGHVHLMVAICAAIGFLIGGYVGGAAAQLLPDRALRRLFAVLLVAMAVDLFRR